MTAEASATLLREGGVRATACSYCRRRLANEYFFTCRRCEASYCYIHMSRHVREACGRQAGRRPREVVVPLQEGSPLLLVVPKPRPSSSANV